MIRKFIVHLQQGRIASARLMAVVHFEDGSRWIIPGDLRRDGSRFRLFAPHRLPPVVYHSLLREANRFARMGDNGKPVGPSEGGCAL